MAFAKKLGAKTAYNLATADAIGGTLAIVGAQGIRADINISAISGTPAATFTLEGYDPGSRSWFTLIASVSKTTTGRFYLQAYPGAPVTANVSDNTIVPQQVRLRVNGTATSITFTATAQLLTDR